MTHEEATQELSALLDGAVEPARRQALDEHLKGCAACKQRLEELRATVSLFKRHGRTEAPALLKTRILAKALEPEEPAVAAMSRVWKPALAFSFVAASAAFIVTSAIRDRFPENAPMGMISSAGGDLGEGYAKSPGVSDDEHKESDFPAAPAAAPMAAKTMQLDRAMTRNAHAPARAVEIGSYLGGGAGAMSAGAAMEYRMEEASDKLKSRQRSATVPALRLFRDEAPFRAYWQSVTSIPVPRIDFSAVMVVVLAEPPAGSLWVAAGVGKGDEGPVVLYRRVRAPILPPQAPGMPPAIQQLPRTNDVISLQEIQQ